jgi:ATP synthase protein I
VPAGTRPRRLVGAPLLTLLAGAVCAAVAGAQLGSRGVVSALLGTAVVVLFFWSGVLPILLSRGQEDKAALGLAVLLVSYTLRLALALLLLRLADRAGQVDGGAIGLTIIVCTVVWTSTQVALLSRSQST